MGNVAAHRSPVRLHDALLPEVQFQTASAFSTPRCPRQTTDQVQALAPYPETSIGIQVVQKLSLTVMYSPRAGLRTCIHHAHTLGI